MHRTKTSPDRSGGRSPRGGLLTGVGLLVLAPAVAAVWLFLAALPALADGGPHVSTINNGSLGINADSCAGCHRAHTASGPFLINAADEEALCLTCHGASGTGSTVDVMTGVQYTLGTGSEVRGTTVLGALRNGGFDLARIGSDAGYRTGTSMTSLRTKVPVSAAAADVTSSHLALAENGLSNPGVAWGNGPISATADPGPVVSLSCASCHNPHGNGKYRILNPIPEPHDGAGFVPAATAVDVTDAPLPPDGDTRNYTVIQVAGPGYLLLASQVVSGAYPPTAGDYFHSRVPWNGSQPDAPNGQPGTFNSQMIAWCASCHSRYFDDIGFFDSGDAIYKYRHVTSGRQACTTCHVSHGTNAAMDGVFAATFPYPDGTVPAVGTPIVNGNSRLLKLDNRGTCQACHDPTGTFPSPVGPTPVPLTP